MGDCTNGERNTYISRQQEAQQIRDRPTRQTDASRPGSMRQRRQCIIFIIGYSPGQFEQVSDEDEKDKDEGQTGKPGKS